MANPKPAAVGKNFSDLASHYIKGDEVPWTPMAQAPGVEVKVLYEDKASGIFTGLFRIPPGGVVPDHVHTALEQTYVLEGSFGDEEGMAKTADEKLRIAKRLYDVCTKDYGLRAEDLIAWCKERLAAYKYPRVVEFVEELPKGPTGKILKRELKA